MVGLEQTLQSGTPQSEVTGTVAPPRLLTEATSPAQTSLLTAPPDVGLDSRAGSRGRRRGRGRRQPQSKHAFEVCLRFVTYQKEVLHHDHIWSVMGLSRHLHLSGEQDDEIDAWLAEQASNAA